MCDYHKIKKDTVEWKYWIHYVDKKVLKEETYCDQICTDTIQAVCSVLKAFDKFEIRKQKEIENRLLAK